MSVDDLDEETDVESEIDSLHNEIKDIRQKLLLDYLILRKQVSDFYDKLVSHFYTEDDFLVVIEHELTQENEIEPVSFDDFLERNPHIEISQKLADEVVKDNKEEDNKSS